MFVIGQVVVVDGVLEGRVAQLDCWDSGVEYIAVDFKKPGGSRSVHLVRPELVKPKESSK
jgi:hypothetical protein